MSKKRIFFMSHSHLTKRYYDAFAFEELIKEHEFVYWDLSLLFRDEDYQDNSILDEHFIKKIFDLKEFKTKLSNLSSNDIIISDIPNNKLIFKDFFTALNKFEGNLLNMDIVTTGPANESKKGIFQKIKDLFLNPKHYFYLVINLLHYKFLLKFNFWRKYDFLFTRGQVISENFNFSLKGNIGINSPDYDAFLLDSSESTGFIYEKKYAVFLDVFLPFHPDLPLMNLPTINNPEKYFLEMNKFFDMVENSYDVEIIIAAHPSAKYTGSEFDNRKIFEFKTKDLVKNSEFVVSHHSNSISYAILYQKNIIFCYTSNMKKIYANSLLKHQADYASYLDLKVFNTSKVKKSDLPDLNEKSLKKNYQTFIDDFLTTQSSTMKTSVEVILNFIKNL